MCATKHIESKEATLPVNAYIRLAHAGSLLVIVCASPAWAQGTDQPGSDIESGFDLGRIIVTAAPEIAVGRGTLNAEAMEAFQRTSLDDAAALIAGVHASNSGGSRNERLLFVRGFDRFQVPLSIDGIRVYLPADNRLDYGRFLTPDLAEIQVAKGYASVLDGPGAMGGAVNLVTRKPVEALEMKGQATLQMDDGLGFAGYTLFGLVGTRQDRWYAQASFVRNLQDHWNLPDSFVPTSSENGGERDFSRSEDWRLNAKVGIMPNATDEYTISYTRQEGAKNAPLSTVDPVAIQRNWSWPYWNLDSLYLLTRTELLPGAELKTRLYRNGFNNLLQAFDDRTQTTQTRARAFNSYYADRAWGGSAQLDLATARKGRISLALHYRSDEHIEYQQAFPSSAVEPEQISREDLWSGAVELARHVVPGLTATAGIGLDLRNLRQAEEFGTPPGGGPSAIFDYPASDAAAINMQGRLDWTAGESSTLYASVSSRTRFPTIFERFSSRFGGAISSPDLQSERATGFELGGTWGGAGVELAGAAFYSRLSDVIVAFPFIFQGQAVSQSRNLGSGDYFGAEASLAANLSPVLNLGANYTWVERAIDDPGNAAFRPTGVPRHKAFFYADWQMVPGLTLIPSLEIVSDRWTVNSAGSRYFRSGAYVDGGLRLDWRAMDRAVIGIGVRNAFDQLYSLADGFPEQGRRFFMTLRID
jgi:iron complex outermembrane receptor protein